MNGITRCARHSLRQRRASLVIPCGVPCNVQTKLKVRLIFNYGKSMKTSFQRDYLRWSYFAERKGLFASPAIACGDGGLRFPKIGTGCDPWWGTLQTFKLTLRVIFIWSSAFMKASFQQLLPQIKTPADAGVGLKVCGERGIRTPGTLIRYASLANWWIKPLSHLSRISLMSQFIKWNM